jgi:hypothetical protein
MRRRHISTYCALGIRNCSYTIRHLGVPVRLIFMVARLYMLVIPDYISKSIRSGDARVHLRVMSVCLSVCLSVCRLFHLHICIPVTSQRIATLMTVFPLHSRCVRRGYLHSFLSFYPFVFEPFPPQTHRNLEFKF